MGTLLESVRECCLEAGWVSGRSNVLMFGDGDGRFAARLLAAEPDVQVTAVDSSIGMLRLLAQRCSRSRDRLLVRRADAREYVPERCPDLVVTHFFLDCLTDDEVKALARRLRPLLAENAVWIVSEFCVPAGWLRWPAWAAIRSLYFAFRLLTGLRVNRLPNHAGALRDCGFEQIAKRSFIRGVLTTEMWVRGR